MAVWVGSIVMYLPTVQEWPVSSAAVPAIVTAYNDQTDICNLTIFPDSVSYVIRKQSVLRGPSKGQYQEIVNLVSLTVDPATAAVSDGNSVQLTATGTYSDQSTADLTATAIWSTSQPSVAMVSGGLVTGKKAGTAQITAVSGSQTNFSNVTVV